MYTWSEFIDEVVRRLTDKKPDNAAFTEAQAEYVKARMASELTYQADLYAIHQNRYTSLRRKLAGYATTLSQSDQRTAVRAMITDTVPDNNQFALACYYWLKANLKMEVNTTPAEGTGWQQLYRAQRIKLLGFAHTYADAAALKAAVLAYMAVDGANEYASSFTDSHLAVVVADLQGLATWFNRQVDAAAADLQSLRDRVVKETRAGVIELQNMVESFKAGQVSILTESDAVPNGSASLLTLPEQAAVKEAWLTWPDDEGVTVCRRCEALLVPWERRFEEMLCGTQTCPQISIDPYGRRALVTPALKADEIELELVWDGLKLSFGDNDPVPFDEGVAQAVSHYVNSRLALELGDTVAVAREYERLFLDRQQLLYLEARDRGTVQRGRYAEAGRCKPCFGGCSSPTASTQTSPPTGLDTYQINTDGTVTLEIPARIYHYSLQAEYAAGTAPYTHTFNLSSRYRVGGNRLELLLGVPASTNPTIIIKDQDSDAELVSFTHDGVAGWFRGDLTFVDGAWQVWGWSRVGT